MGIVVALLGAPFFAALVWRGSSRTHDRDGHDAFGGAGRAARPHVVRVAALSIEAIRELMLVNPYDGEIFAGTLRTNIAIRPC